MRLRTLLTLRAEWTIVPWRFWVGVWVGWRMRMDSVVRSKAAELRSWIVRLAGVSDAVDGGFVYRMCGEKNQVVHGDTRPYYSSKLLKSVIIINRV